MLRFFSFVLLVGILLSSCVESQNQFSKIPPGIWRGVLYLKPVPEAVFTDKDEITRKIDDQGELPFNFEVVYDDNEKFHIVLHNAEERIVVNDILFGRDRTTAKDTLNIQFPEYDSYISAVYEEKVMEGYWHVNFKENYKVKFKATHGDTSRFKKGIVQTPSEFSGKWETTFEPNTDHSYEAIGDFNQKGNQLTGTFLTETGDYRFLEGIVANNKAFLSCFDGAHAFLFEFVQHDTSNLSGMFYSGSHYLVPFSAIKNNNASLTDPFALNTVTAPEEPVQFTFKDHSGKLIDINDEKFKGKPKILEIMGTWCPNCMDATNYLQEFQSNNPTTDIEIMSICFERYKNEEKNLNQIARYKKKKNITWPVLLGEHYRKSEASKLFPKIDRLISYPTLVFLDKDNMVKYVYTGFSGPATEAYHGFHKRFNEIINELTNE